MVAELDEGRQCMEEILVLYEFDAENVAIRERLTMGLANFGSMTHEEEKNFFRRVAVFERSMAR